ncbi:hypothetical protein ASF27_01720 [Methylobacterium sp. Leaf102]|uniref:hypothetical protein n=1 Tax=Methylobacterium sp. Leaf102 TaxID=1736253 RepID=UPI0006F1F6BE|nr:hypothetical protein [Methylobacterium sp. Leaf102]KQP34305.1 hypothetical protein ASF27_01720 [Methylobacterium sp. Leaf102]
MAEPLTLSFQADTSRAQGAMASLAASVIGNMTSIGVAMSGGAANTNSFGATLQGLANNAGRAAQAVGADVSKIATNTVAAASKEGATLEGIVRSFTAAAATSNTAQAAIQSGTAATSTALGTLIAQVPSLKTLLGAFLAFEAAKLVFASVTASIDEAREHVEDFVRIGKDAEKAGVGSGFFQRATLDAKEFGLTVEQVTSALTAARAATRVTIGEGRDGVTTSPLDNRLRQNVQAGNITAADKAVVDGAGTQEAKIRAVLDLIDKLRAASRDAAAFDLAGKFLGPDFERRMRDGADVVDKLRDKLDSGAVSAGGVRIISDEEIERANALDAKMREISNTLSAAWAPIAKKISTATLDTYENFLLVEGAIARVLTIASNLYVQMGAIVGEVRSTVAAIPGIGGILTANPFNLHKRVGQALGIVEPDAPAESSTTLPEIAKTADRSKSLPSLHASPRGGSGSERLDAVETLISQLEKARDTARAELENVAKTNVEREKAVALAKAEAAAREEVKKGNRDSAELTSDERARVLGAAEAWQSYKDRVMDANQAIRQASDSARYFGEAASGAFADAILEGKSFGDILTSLSKQFARSAIQSSFTGQGPLAGLLGTAPTASSGDTVGGIAGLFTSLFKPGASGSSGTGTGSFLSGLFRANGGPVEAGRSYTVGEIGREIFVPGESGRMYPVAKDILFPTAGSAAGTASAASRPIQVQMTVQASDAASFLRSESQVTAALFRAVQRGARAS